MTIPRQLVAPPNEQVILKLLAWIGQLHFCEKQEKREKPNLFFKKLFP